jgi:hypothetical protein
VVEQLLWVVSLIGGKQALDEHFGGVELGAQCDPWFSVGQCGRPADGAGDVRLFLGTSVELAIA